MGYNKKEVLENNIEAIKIALSGKDLNDKEKDILRKYQGFGGIKSVLLPPDNPNLFPNSDKNLVPLVKELHEVLKTSNEGRDYEEYVSSIKNSVLTSFYTPEPLVKAINDSFGDIHFSRMLEPSAGAGVFLDNIVANEKVAIEKDLLTGKILSALHPNHEVMIQGFQKIPTSHENSYDLVVSNIPFGNFAVFDSGYARNKDKNRKKATATIHNYFFVKGMDMLKDGGVLAFTQVSEQINRARKVLVCYLCNCKHNQFHPNLFYAHENKNRKKVRESHLQTNIRFDSSIHSQEIYLRP